jgi:hypothetical protein
MSKFRDKLLDVNAFQFSVIGDVPEVVSLFGKPLTVAIDPVLSLSIDAETINIGDWLVKDADGKIEVVSPADFGLRFVAVDPQGGL